MMMPEAITCSVLVLFSVLFASEDKQPVPVPSDEFPPGEHLLLRYRGPRLLTPKGYPLGNVDPRQQAETLKSKEVRERRLAIYQLAWCGPGAQAVTPALIAALKDPDAYVRTYAANCLGWQKAEADKSTPALLEALRDRAVHVRRASALSLQRLQPRVKEVVPALLESLKDADACVRIRSAGALVLLGERGTKTFRVLAEGLDAKELDLYGEAIYTLSDIGLPAVPTLVSCLSDKRPRVRSGAAGALAGFAHETKRQQEAFPPEAIRSLTTAISDSDEEVARSAIDALSVVGEPAKEAISAIVQAMKKRSRGVRIQAASSLAQFGVAARVAVPALVEALKDEDEYVRRGAAESLKALDPAEARKQGLQ